MPQAARAQRGPFSEMTSQTKKPALSIVVCARNAQSHLEECLKTLLWADELVVWDNESTDKTVEIARKFTPNVFVKKMEVEGTYRNFTFGKTRNRWVMYVDPDERVPEPLRDEIIRTLNLREKYVGYSIPRKNIYAGRYWIRNGGLYPAPQLRVFLKDRFRFEEVEIHGRNFLEGEWRYLSEPIVHHLYHDFAEMIKKTNRQTTLEVIKWERDGRPFGLFPMFRKSLDRFFKAFFLKQAWRDGLIGFMIGFLSSFYQTTSFFKRWEQTHPGGEGLFHAIQRVNEVTTQAARQMDPRKQHFNVLNVNSLEDENDYEGADDENLRGVFEVEFDPRENFDEVINFVRQQESDTL